MALPLHVQNTHPVFVEGCMGCKLANVAIGFHMCPGGKAEFHGATINERRTRMIAEAEKKGNHIEPKNTSAWATIPPKSQLGPA